MLFSTTRPRIHRRVCRANELYCSNPKLYPTSSNIAQSTRRVHTILRVSIWKGPGMHTCRAAPQCNLKPAPGVLASCSPHSRRSPQFCDVFALAGTHMAKNKRRARTSGKVKTHQACQAGKGGLQPRGAQARSADGASAGSARGLPGVLGATGAQEGRLRSAWSHAG